jgi:hypothetical protein
MYARKHVGHNASVALAATTEEACAELAAFAVVQDSS